MKQIFKSFAVLTVLFLFSGAYLCSQTTETQNLQPKENEPEQFLIGSAGASEVGDNFHLEWAIGEPLSETYSQAEIILTQGLLQGNITISSITEPASEYVLCVFPNPTADFVTIHSDASCVLSFIIKDVNGRTVFQDNLSSNSEQIDFTAQPSGLYFLTLLSGNIVIANYKIIKQN